MHEPGGEDNRNVARMAALLAGFPVEVPGQTVNRLCGSGLQAIASAAQAIKAGEGDAFVAGGVENMTRAPYVMLKIRRAVESSGSSLLRTRPSAAVRQPEDECRLDDFARHDRREGREGVQRHARGTGRVRARKSAACRVRHP
jgi:acetyl-CoA acetyltransferase